MGKKRKLSLDTSGLSEVEEPSDPPPLTNQRGLTDAESDILCDILDHSTDARERMKAGQMLFFGVPSASVLDF
jgi:hypothetical protein